MSGSKVSPDKGISGGSGIAPERLEEVKRKIGSSGLTMADWARRNGFSIKLVHEILSGRRSCVRGQSHRIAVMLGLKDGDLPDIDQRLGGTPSLKNKP